MTPAQQSAVTDAMEYARQVNDDARIAEEAKDIQTLQDNGITVTKPDKTEFKTKVQAYYTSHPEQTSDWDMTLYKEIQDAAK
jgi:TRAP-type C4-dicarboxylate transport system substrate-binding protein